MSIFEPFRWLIGQGVLGYERLSRKAPITRSAEAQAEVDEKLKKLSLYEFRSCPFCMIVRKVTHHKNLKIELRDARRNDQWKEELVNQGGKFQVPCLRIQQSKGEDTWLYESSAIMEYLDKHFPTPS